MKIAGTMMASMDMMETISLLWLNVRCAIARYASTMRPAPFQATEPHTDTCRVWQDRRLMLMKDPLTTLTMTILTMTSDEECGDDDCDEVQEGGDE